MDIGLIGINVESAGLSERESFTSACQKLQKALPFPSVLLATCERTELYFLSCDLPRVCKALESHSFPLYVKEGSECFFHLARVTAGLSSALVGETDIQRQVKLAYQCAVSAGALSSSLHFLFQKCLKVGKSARSIFPLAESSLSLEKVVFEYAVKQIESFRQAPILFIGYSATNRKIISYFQKKGATNVSLCTRSMEVASGFALRHNILLVGWDRLAFCTQYQGVIVATHSLKTLLPHSLFANAPIPPFICDLSVPRCVDVKLKGLNMDQITHALIQRRKTNTAFRKESLGYMRKAVEKQIQIYNTKQKRDVVCA